MIKTVQSLYSSVASKSLCLVLGSVAIAGCTSTVEVKETYLKPAEIDMSGKRTVVLESQGVYENQGAAVLSKLKQSLMAKDFTVADRGAMDAVAREQFFGDGQSAEIAAAAALIRINVLSHNQNSNRENKTEERGKDEDRRTVYLRRTVGGASTEVAFDVVELGTTQTLVSRTFSAERYASTNWDEDSAGYVDTASLLSICYDDVVSAFMRQIAPYAVQVEHDLYPMEKEFPQTKIGVSYIQAGKPDQAYEEFEAALYSARSNPEVEPKTLALLTHNMAVAREKAGNYEAALQLYIDSTQYEDAPDQTENIARCQARLRDYDRLLKQGVDPTAPVSNATVRSREDADTGSSVSSELLGDLLGELIDAIE